MWVSGAIQLVLDQRLTRRRDGDHDIGAVHDLREVAG